MGTGTGSFGVATNFTIGLSSQPISLTSADFNGDGKADLATANSGTNTVSVLLGTGTGSFGPATNYVVGGVNSNPYSVISKDLNGDGIPDLAVANFGSSNVSILIGHNTGIFSNAANLSVGLNEPISITSADFNGDGLADLAVVNFVSSVEVIVFLNIGSFSFSEGGNFMVGANPASVISADFNGDGFADLATANSTSNNVSVLIGNGTGSFATATDFTVGTTPWGVCTADFNGDGKADLAIANSGTNTASVLLNTLPFVSISGHTIICEGTTTTLTANGASSYTWSTGATTSTISVSPTVDTTYTVIGQYVSTCTRKDSFEVEVFLGTLPTVTATSNTTSLCIDSTATLQASGATTYTWSTSATSSTISITPTVTTTYTVTGAYANGCINAATVTQVVTNCGATTDMEQVTNINNQVNIYPNPNNGTFIIETDSPEKQTLHIYDMNGKLVLTQSINGRTDIDASSLNEGIYNVSIISDESIINKRLIIVK